MSFSLPTPPPPPFYRSYLFSPFAISPSLSSTHAPRNYTSTINLTPAHALKPTNTCNIPLRHQYHILTPHQANGIEETNIIKMQKYARDYGMDVPPSVWQWAFDEDDQNCEYKKPIMKRTIVRKVPKPAKVVRPGVIASSDSEAEEEEETEQVEIIAEEPPPVPIIKQPNTKRQIAEYTNPALIIANQDGYTTFFPTDIAKTTLTVREVDLQGNTITERNLPMRTPIKQIVRHAEGQITVRTHQHVYPNVLETLDTLEERERPKYLAQDVAVYSDHIVLFGRHIEDTRIQVRADQLEWSEHSPPYTALYTRDNSVYMLDTRAKGESSPIYQCPSPISHMNSAGWFTTQHYLIHLDIRYPHPASLQTHNFPKAPFLHSDMLWCDTVISQQATEVPSPLPLAVRKLCGISTAAEACLQVGIDGDTTLLLAESTINDSRVID